MIAKGKSNWMKLDKARLCLQSTIQEENETSLDALYKNDGNDMMPIRTIKSLIPVVIQRLIDNEQEERARVFTNVPHEFASICHGTCACDTPLHSLTNI